MGRGARALAERLEHGVAELGRDAGAGVLDRQQHPVAAGRLLDRVKGTLVILNNDETALDDRADLIVRGKMGEIFSALWERLKKYERDTARD